MKQLTVSTPRLLIALLFSCLCVTAVRAAEPVTDDITQLKARVAELEKQVQELSKVVESLKPQQTLDTRQKALREKFEKKMAADRAKYSRDQLHEAEGLYQIANKKWGTDEAMASLQAMIKDFPDINRTGCAILYVAQRSSGDDRAKYLKQCIEKHNDCYYGDGVQVGAYARFLLALDYQHAGDQEHAKSLVAELKSQYADAIDHSGKLLTEMLPKDSE